MIVFLNFIKFCQAVLYDDYDDGKLLDFRKFFVSHLSSFSISSTTLVETRF